MNLQEDMPVQTKRSFHQAKCSLKQATLARAVELSFVWLDTIDIIKTNWPFKTLPLKKSKFPGTFGFAMETPSI